jgi:hypothetical protein
MLTKTVDSGSATSFKVHSMGAVQVVDANSWSIAEEFTQPIDDVTGEDRPRIAERIIDTHRCTFNCGDAAAATLWGLLEKAQSTEADVVFEVNGRPRFTLKGIQPLRQLRAPSVRFFASYFTGHAASLRP